MEVAKILSNGQEIVRISQYKDSQLVCQLLVGYGTNTYKQSWLDVNAYLDQIKGTYPNAVIVENGNRVKTKSERVVMPKGKIKH